MHNSQFNETVTNILQEFQKNFKEFQNLSPIEFAKNFVNFEEFQKIQTKQKEQILQFIQNFNKDNNDLPSQIMNFSNQLTSDFKNKFEQSIQMHKEMLKNITSPEYKEQVDQIIEVNEKLADINHQMLETTQNYFTNIMELNKEGLAILKAFNPIFFTPSTNVKPKKKVN